MWEGGVPVDMAELFGRLADDVRSQVARVAGNQGCMDDHVAMAKACREELERARDESAALLERTRETLASLQAGSEREMHAICHRASEELSALRDEASLQWSAALAALRERAAEQMAAASAEGLRTLGEIAARHASEEEARKRAWDDLVRDTREAAERELAKVADVTGMAREEAATAAREELDDLRSALAVAQAEAADAVQTVRRVQKEVQKTLDASKKAAEDVVAGGRQRVETLNDQFKKLQRQHQSHEDEMKSQRKLQAAQESQLSALQGRVAALSDELSRERKSNADLRSKIRDLNGAVAKLSSRLSDVVDGDLRGLREDVKAVSATLPVRLFLRRREHQSKRSGLLQDDAR